MEQQAPAALFGEERAAAYDSGFAKLAPLKEALHLCMRLVLAELPADARILCVGAGTGAELLYLAEAYPGWSFTLVDPAAPMLRRCREKAEQAGIGARCTYHEGYLASLSDGEAFHAATSILVSQFILDPAQRLAYFRDIATRLNAGGIIITADLVSPPGDSLFDLWVNLMRYNGLSADALDQYRMTMREHVAISTPEEIDLLLLDAGFEQPERIFQTLLIHSWQGRRARGRR